MITMSRDIRSPSEVAEVTGGNVERMRSALEIFDYPDGDGDE